VNRIETLDPSIYVEPTENSIATSKAANSYDNTPSHVKKTLI